MNYMKIDPPLPEGLIEELIDFWEVTFELSFKAFQSILEGDESEENLDTVYLLREKELLVSTCHLTSSKALPQLGGLGEVATHHNFRRQGLASLLCEHARNDFRRRNGEALFLGTVNPDARRVYHRLGWRKLAGANVMALNISGESPEAFLVDYFREGGSVTVTAGTAAGRVPMIPLIVCPHDWQGLDANAELFSTRYAIQSSCMGLYPRYAELVEDGRGAWFEARNDLGRLVGLATARLDESGVCQVDGFTHGRFQEAFNDLIQAAMDWGQEKGAAQYRARLSVEDEDKRKLFEALGFDEVGEGDAFTIDGREVGSVNLGRVG